MWDNEEMVFVCCYHNSSKLSLLIKKMSWMWWQTIVEKLWWAENWNSWRFCRDFNQSSMHFAPNSPHTANSHVKVKTCQTEFLNFSFTPSRLKKNLKQIVVARAIDSFEVEKAFQVSINVSETFSSPTNLISLCINQSAVESNKREFKLLISTCQ